jgi:N-acetylmuramoyl-L-alanine amidase
MVAGGIFLILAAIFGFIVGTKKERAALNMTAQGTKATVVIDAGHGGFDPGKVGTQDTLEKDINLAIAKKVEKTLTDSGYTVYMTRTEDTALYDEGAAKKKMSDLQNRVKIINEANPVVAVSIHQNSYSAETKGTQVFYYKNSEKGKILAKQLQDAVREVMGDENKRVERGNDSYYMLKNVECPFVIVECGFLSNPEEETLLKDESYQQKMALGICEGIERYLYS